jgi:prepilin-type N-terminal cleavage/methylation domain-containing protein
VRTELAFPNGKRRNQSGMTLVELMFAMVILAVGLGALNILFIFASETDNKNSKATSSTMLAQKVLEQISAQHPDSIQVISLTDCAGNAWNINTAGSPAPTGTGARVETDTSSPFYGGLDPSPDYAAIPVGYAMQYTDCGVGGRQTVYDVRWNIMTVDQYTRLITVSAGQVSPSNQLGGKAALTSHNFAWHRRNAMRQRIPKLSGPAHTREVGFSLLELLLVVAILTVVLGVVVRGAVELQARSATEVAKVDLTQQSRQFMDQVVKDLHHAGYPSVRMYDQATSTANPALYGQGLINISSNAIVFEGDVDGSGNVSVVFVQLNPLNGPCPCILQRGSVYKQAYLTGNMPQYYTQVDNVMNLNPFSAILNDGTTTELPCTIATGGCPDGNSMANIKAVGLALNVRTGNPSTEDGKFSTITMSSEAKINN